MTDQQIFNIMIEFFEDEDWEFEWMEGASVLRMGFSGENGRWICYAQAREPQQQFVFYSVMAVNAPPEKRYAVAEYITRANYGMVIGNYEMDFSDGEIRYKTSIDVEGSGITTALIQQCVYANVIVSDRYLPGLMRVIYGDIDPEIALLELGIDEALYPVDDGSDAISDATGDVDDEYEDTFGYLDKYDDDSSDDPPGSSGDDSGNGFNPDDLPDNLKNRLFGNNDDTPGDNQDGSLN